MIYLKQAARRAETGQDVVRAAAEALLVAGVASVSAYCLARVN